MSIRSATAADVPAIIAVELSAGTLFEGTHMAWAVGETSTVAQLLELIDRRLVWVSEIDGSVAGYLSGEPLDGAFHIEEVAVSRAHHRQGVGRALLENVAEWAREMGFDALTLTRHIMNVSVFRLLQMRICRRNCETPWLKSLIRTVDVQW